MIKKIISILPAVLSVLFLLWLGLSWFDIVLDNNALHPVHNNFNLFVLLFEGVKIW